MRQDASGVGVASRLGYEVVDDGLARCRGRGPRRAQRVYISLGKLGDKILGLSDRFRVQGGSAYRAGSDRRDMRDKSV